jgi:hypothetical protein
MARSVNHGAVAVLAINWNRTAPVGVIVEIILDENRAAVSAMTIAGSSSTRQVPV